MISREKAISVLQKIIDSGILAAYLEDALEDIVICIDSERDRLHLWGAEDDAIDLFTETREDLITPETVERMEIINRRYAFMPSPYEAQKAEEEDA